MGGRNQLDDSINDALDNIVSGDGVARQRGPTVAEEAAKLEDKYVATSFVCSCFHVHLQFIILSIALLCYDYDMMIMVG
jgi:hypothetical protein